MSVNLPFLLLAVAQLGVLEAMTIACANSALQTFPRNWARPKLEQLLFNISTAGVASTVSWFVLHSRTLGHLPAALLVAFATVVFFLGQTASVSAIISLTGGGSWVRVWKDMALLMFPYFVLSAGVAFMMGASAHLRWQVPITVLPVMFGVFLSYQLYFRMAATEEKPLALSAGAGH
jgi:hypothetical protein